VVGDAVNLDSVNNETDVLLLASVSLTRLSVEDVNSAVLFLTDDAEALRGVKGLGTHVWGAISPDASADEIAAAIQSVGEGLWVVAPGLGQSLMRLPKSGEFSGEESLIESLTAREKEVLQLMAEGLANKQIAMRLSISEHTVKFHLSSLYSKLGVSSRTEAVKRGLGLGLISL
jgi:DNA-binding NarL/FixJ family response regulator